MTPSVTEESFFRVAAMAIVTIIAFLIAYKTVIQPAVRIFHPLFADYATLCTTTPGIRVCCMLQGAANSNVAVHNVTLQHQQNLVTAVPVDFSFTYPVDDPATRMPLVMLLNGASVESYWYRRVVAQLASKGYVVVTSDYYRPYTIPIPNLPSDAQSLIVLLHVTNTCHSTNCADLF